MIRLLVSAFACAHACVHAAHAWTHCQGEVMTPEALHGAIQQGALIQDGIGEAVTVLGVVTALNERSLSIEV